MATRADLPEWALEALAELGGTAHPVEVAKVVWRRHEPDLRASGDLFYTWQYDLRWAGTTLRKQGLLYDNARGQKWALAGLAISRSPGHTAHDISSELEVGSEYSRFEINALYGGQRQSGIVTPKRHQMILLFSSPSGQAFGYNDGWESPDVYLYFGQGQKGDMEFKRGNRAITAAETEQKPLHLFVRETKAASTYRYEGVFRCEGFDWVDANTDGRDQARRAIRFRLARVLA